MVCSLGKQVPLFVAFRLSILDIGKRPRLPYSFYRTIDDDLVDSLLAVIIAIFVGAFSFVRTNGFINYWRVHQIFLSSLEKRVLLDTSNWLVCRNNPSNCHFASFSCDYLSMRPYYSFNALGTSSKYSKFQLVLLFFTI